LVAFYRPGELDRATLSGVGRPKPGPIAQISPNPLELGEKQREGKVTIINTGQSALSIDGISVDDPKNFELKTKDCMASSPLERGQSCTIDVKFKGKKSTQGVIILRHKRSHRFGKGDACCRCQPFEQEEVGRGAFRCRGDYGSSVGRSIVR
jgi:hypothetical protein